MCSKWLDGEAKPPEITWTPQATCAGWLTRTWHPTFGDAEFLDLTFNGLSVPSEIGDFRTTVDRF
jgi:hypothetical protein